jgi:hypothetical protein
VPTVAVEFVPLCTLCFTPLTGTSPSYCHECLQTAVRTQADVVRHLPAVKAGLTMMNLRLMYPVRVDLVSAEEMARRSGDPYGAVSGLTETSQGWARSLSIVSGLPRLQFGATVAHEFMHAWLAEQGVVIIHPILSEGLCEFVSYAWLHRENHPHSRKAMKVIAENGDPVYGDGFRLVLASNNRYGTWRMLRSVINDGRLP